jgi:hypothetical protein
MMKAPRYGATVIIAKTEKVETAGEGIGVRRGVSQGD